MIKKENYNLYLDDLRFPNESFRYTNNSIYLTHPWKIVRNYDEFVKIITTKGLPSIISFDHDLADEHYAPEIYWNKYQEWEEKSNFKEKTGYECANWFVTYCLDNNVKYDDFPLFYSHSMNPTGREKIISLLRNFKKHLLENKNDV